MKGRQLLEALSSHWRSGIGTGGEDTDIYFVTEDGWYVPLDIKQEPIKGDRTATVVYLLEAEK